MRFEFDDKDIKEAKDDKIDDFLFSDTSLNISQGFNTSIKDIPPPKLRQETTNWQSAQHTSKDYTEEQKKSLGGVKKAILVLALAGLGITAYNIGYNLDFTQHFWDDTKAKLEERQKEMDAYDKIAESANQENTAGEDLEGGDR